MTDWHERGQAERGGERETNSLSLSNIYIDKCSYIVWLCIYIPSFVSNWPCIIALDSAEREG